MESSEILLYGPKQHNLRDGILKGLDQENLRPTLAEDEASLNLHLQSFEFHLLILIPQNKAELQRVTGHDLPKLIIAQGELAKLAKSIPQSHVISPKKNLKKIKEEMTHWLYKHQGRQSLIDDLELGLFQAERLGGQVHWSNQALHRLLGKDVTNISDFFLDQTKEIQFLEELEHGKANMILRHRPNKGDNQYLQIRAELSKGGRYLQGRLEDVTAQHEESELSDLLRDLTDHLSIKLNREWIGNILASFTLKSFEFTSFSLILFDDPGYTPLTPASFQAEKFKKGVIEFQGIHTDVVQHKKINLKKDHPLLKLCYEKNESFLAADIHDELIRLGAKNNPLGKDSWLVPCFFQNRMLGILALNGLPKQPERMQRISRFFDYLRHQLGAILENSNLVSDLEGQVQKRTREIEKAELKLMESEEIAQLLRSFERFVPLQFIRRLAPQGVNNIQPGAAQGDFITLLFSDIRAFTSMAEEMHPAELFDFLNSYFSYMNQAIQKNGGFVDKFIGDAIMAVFDNQGLSDHLEAMDGVQAAIAMQQALTKFNAKRNHGENGPIKTGIGLHSGHVIIGTVGTMERMEATLVGDAVNIASRLEDLTKAYGVGICASHDTIALLPSRKDLDYRVMDMVRVEGRKDSIRIYEIFNADPAGLRKKKLATHDFIKKALLLRKKRNWGAAAEVFEKALAISPNDPVIELHLKRITEYRLNPPDEHWDGGVDLRKSR